MVATLSVVVAVLGGYDWGVCVVGDFVAADVGAEQLQDRCSQLGYSSMKRLQHIR